MCVLEAIQDTRLFLASAWSLGGECEVCWLLCLRFLLLGDGIYGC